MHCMRLAATGLGDCSTVVGLHVLILVINDSVFIGPPT